MYSGFPPQGTWECYILVVHEVEPLVPHTVPRPPGMGGETALVFLSPNRVGMHL
jgi:hypothetical protein